MSNIELMRQAIKQLCQEEGEPEPSGDELDAELQQREVVRLADIFAGLVLAESAELKLARNRVEMLDKALAEWSDKTDWVRKTVQVPELGLHLADVMSARLKAAALAGPVREPAPVPIPEWVKWTETDEFKAAWARSVERQRKAARGEEVPEPQNGKLLEIGATLAEAAPPIVQHLPADDTEGGAT